MSKNSRFKAIPAVYLVLENFADRTILMLKRANTGYFDDFWSLPAGHVDGGEPATQACMREAQEEIGVVVDPRQLVLVHLVHRPDFAQDGNERLDMFFWAPEWKGEPTNCEPHKCSALEWHKTDQMPNNTVPEVRQAITCLSEGIPYSEIGWE